MLFITRFRHWHKNDRQGGNPEVARNGQIVVFNVLIVVIDSFAGKGVRMSYLYP